MPFHTQFKPFGPQPIGDQDHWSEFPNPPVWPKQLLGKSFEWCYERGDSGQGHAWLIRQTGGSGFEFRLFGALRVWSGGATEPGGLGEDMLARILVAAIGGAFLRRDPPKPNQRTEIDLCREDFVQAGAVAP